MLVKYEMTVEQEKSFWQKFCCNLYEKTKSVSFKGFRRKKVGITILVNQIKVISLHESAGCF